MECTAFLHGLESGVIEASNADHKIESTAKARLAQAMVVYHLSCSMVYDLC